MPGLIDIAVKDPTKTNVAGTDVYGASVKGYDPSLTTVNTDTDTVSAQLDKILGKDSPYVTRARANAAGVANSRGLINSSIAAGAGEAAAIDASLPIAAADASTFNTTRLANQGVINAAGQFNAGSVNKAAGDFVGESNLAARQGTDFAGRTALQDKAAADKLALSAQEAEQLSKLQGEKITGELAASKELKLEDRTTLTDIENLKSANNIKLGEIEATYRSLIQASASTASMFNNSQSQIAAIMADTKTTAAQKKAAVDAVTGLLESGLTAIGAAANADLAGVLDFSGGTVAAKQPDLANNPKTPAQTATANAAALETARDAPIAGRPAAIASMLGIVSVRGKTALNNAISGKIFAMSPAAQDAHSEVVASLPEAEMKALNDWQIGFQQRRADAMQSLGLKSLTAKQLSNLAVSLPVNTP